MKKFLTIFLATFAGLLLLAFMLLNLGFTRRFATRQVNQILHRSEIPVQLETIEKILPNNVEAAGVRITGPQGEAIIEAGSVSARIRLLALLRSKVLIREVYIHGASVDLKADQASGRINIAAAFSSTAADEPKPGAADWKISVRSGVLEQVIFRMSDSLAGIHMNFDVEYLGINNFKILILERSIISRSLDVRQFTGSMGISPKRIPEDSSPGESWKLDPGKIRLSNADFSFTHDEQELWLRTQTKELLLDAKETDLAGPYFEVNRLRIMDSDLEIRAGAFPSNQQESPLLSLVYEDSLLHLSGIRLDLAEALMHPDRIQLVLREFNARTSKGELIAKINGRLDSHQQQTRLELDARILQSRLGMEARAGQCLDSILSHPTDPGPLTLQIKESEILPFDLGRLFPGFDSVPPALLKKDAAIKIRGQMEFSGDELEITSLNLEQDRHARFELEGRVRDPFTPARMHAFVQSSVQAPPGRAFVSADVNFLRDSFMVSSTFEDVSPMLITDGKGPDGVYGTIDMTGAGLTLDSLEGCFTLRLDSLFHATRPYHEIELEGRYDKGDLQGTLRSRDPAIEGLLNVSAFFGDAVMQINTEGSIKAQLHELGFSGDSMSVQSRLDGSLSLFADSLSSRLGTSQLSMEKSGQIHEIGETSATFGTGPDHTSATVHADFAQLHAQLSTPFSDLGDLKEVFGAYFRGFSDSAALHSSDRLLDIPEILAGANLRDHELWQVLSGDTGIHFGNLELSVEHRKQEQNLNARIKGEELKYKGIKSGLLEAVLSDTAGKLTLNLDAFESTLGSGPEFQWDVDGVYADRHALAGIRILDKEKEVVYGFDLEGNVNGSILAVSLASDHVILNRTGWEAKESRILSLDLGTRKARPEIYLQSGPSELHFQVVGGQDPGLYRLAFEKVGLEKLWRPDLIPGNPSGQLSGTFHIARSSGDSTGIAGGLIIQDAAFAGVNFDSISLDGNLDLFGKGALQTSWRMHMDSSFLDLKAWRNGSDQLDVETGFHQFPLRTIEPLARKYIHQLQGNISGDFRIRDQGKGPDLDGQIRVHGVEMTVNALNTRFAIPDQQLKVENERILFNNFQVRDTLNKALIVNGTVDIGPGLPPSASLEVISNRLKLMSRDPMSQAPFTGNIFLDSRFSIKGQLSRPNIEGKILLSRGSEIYYQLLEDFSLSDREQIVDFTSSGPAANESEATLTTHHREFIKSSIETSVEIDPSTLLNFRVARRIYNLEMNIIGGGTVAFALLDNNRSTLSGRYVINEGEAYLKLTGWPNKEFNILRGGYVRWDGRVDNPELNIQAVNQVRSTYLNPVDGKRMEADFNVTLSMTNYLSDLDVQFGVQTNDQYIMSILNTLSPEEQMQQAVSILLFETIDLPGISSSTDYMTQQVNQIVSAQLNQLTRTSIKGIDISFGLDSYTEPTQGGQSTNTNLTYEVRKSMLNNRAQFELKGRIADVNEQPGASDVSLHDVSFEYQLDSAANNFLKVYNKKSYDDVFEGEVMKTGMGYTYRKKYRSLSDIWKRKKQQDKP